MENFKEILQTNKLKRSEDFVVMENFKEILQTNKLKRSEDFVVPHKLFTTCKTHLVIPEIGRRRIERATI
jgi:hypothetical protein